MKAQRHRTARAPRPEEAGPPAKAMPNGGPSVLPRTRSAEGPTFRRTNFGTTTPPPLAKGLRGIFLLSFSLFFLRFCTSVS